MRLNGALYGDRSYYAVAAGEFTRLEQQVGMIVTLVGNSPMVTQYDPIFLFRNGYLVAKYEVVTVGQSQSMAPNDAGESRWLVPVLATKRSSETELLGQRVDTGDSKMDFLLRHSRRQVVEAVWDSLVASQQEHDSAAHKIPVWLGDRLLDAYQLPNTDYHWHDGDD